MTIRCGGEAELPGNTSHNPETHILFNKKIKKLYENESSSFDYAGWRSYFRRLR
jgi:hypothetical protein